MSKRCLRCCCIMCVVPSVCDACTPLGFAFDDFTLFSSSLLIRWLGRVLSSAFVSFFVSLLQVISTFLVKVKVVSWYLLASHLFFKDRTEVRYWMVVTIYAEWRNKAHDGAQHNTSDMFNRLIYYPVIYCAYLKKRHDKSFASGPYYGYEWSHRPNEKPIRSPSTTQTLSWFEWIIIILFVTIDDLLTWSMMILSPAKLTSRLCLNAHNVAIPEALSKPKPLAILIWRTPNPRREILISAQWYLGSLIIIAVIYSQ